MFRGSGCACVACLCKETRNLTRQLPNQEFSGMLRVGWSRVVGFKCNSDVFLCVSCNIRDVVCEVTLPVRCECGMCDMSIYADVY